MTLTDHEQIRKAGGNDVADWGEKDMSGAYEPGTKFMVNGRPFHPGNAPAVGSEDPGKKPVRAPVRS